MKKLGTIMTRMTNKARRVTNSLSKIGYASGKSGSMFEKPLSAHNFRAARDAIEKAVPKKESDPINYLTRSTLQLGNHFTSAASLVPGFRLGRDLVHHTVIGLRDRYNRQGALKGVEGTIRYRAVKEYIYDKIVNTKKDKNGKENDKNDEENIKNEIRKFLSYVVKSPDTKIQLSMMAHLYDTLEENNELESGDNLLHNQYKNTLKQMLVMNGNALFTNVISKLNDDINRAGGDVEKARKLTDMQTMLPMRFRVNEGVTSDNVTNAMENIVELLNEFKKVLLKRLEAYQKIVYDQSTSGGKRKSHKRRQRHPSRKHTKREHRNRKNKTNKKRKSKRRSVRRTVRRR